VAVSRTPCACVYADLAASALPAVRMLKSNTAEPSRTSPAIHVISAAGVMAMRHIPGRRLVSTRIRDSQTSPDSDKPSVKSVGQSGNAAYDLDAPGTVVDLYRAVLIEAAAPQDLYAYLDEKVLGRLWALLWLPAQLRKAWEQRFRSWPRSATALTGCCSPTLSGR